MTGPCSSHPSQRKLPYMSAVAVRGWSKHRTPPRPSEGPAVGYPCSSIYCLMDRKDCSQHAVTMRTFVPLGSMKPCLGLAHSTSNKFHIPSLQCSHCDALSPLKQRGQVAMDCNLRGCEPSEPFKPLNFSSIPSQR